jgi:hypothetical protein
MGLNDFDAKVKNNRNPGNTLITTKEAHISIRETSGIVHGGCNLVFEMRDQVVDQTFRFNELENRNVE